MPHLKRQALLRNIDDLAEAEAPGMVFHTATVLPKKERCAVTGGLFVLEPSATEYSRAIHHLHHELNIGSNGGRRCYDGSDQEFWRSYYRPITELPMRYHAHQFLKMNKSEWHKVWHRGMEAEGWRQRDGGIGMEAEGWR